MVTIRSRVLRACLFLVGTIAAAPAFAGFINLDFDGVGTPFEQTQPYLEDGFRLTPNCHWDISTVTNPNGSNWLGWDSSGCNTQPATLRLDRGGARFDLLSMELVADPIFRAISSAGGDQVLRFGGTCDGSAVCQRDFTDSVWRNLTFIEFSIISDFGDPQGFDNIRLVAVDEPSTLALMLFGFGGIAWQRRRTRPSV
ncbi:MAG TPA: PEP-CTERM sorting domain-containing protein [Steroidobacteraceae bacterium]